VIFLSGAVAQPQSGETFKAGVTVIQVPVVVRDHDGHVVSNLGKDDFQLFTDGKRQEITTFSVENPGQAAPDRSLPDGKAPAAQPARGTGTEIPARFITYLFDDVNIRDFGDLKRIRDAAARGNLAHCSPAIARPSSHRHALYHSISPTTGRSCRTPYRACNRVRRQSAASRRPRHSS